jgi:hypothetical protein
MGTSRGMGWRAPDEPTKPQRITIADAVKIFLTNREGAKIAAVYHCNCVTCLRTQMTCRGLRRMMNSWTK